MFSHVESWSCALEFGQIRRRIGLFFFLLVLWRLELGAVEKGIVVSFNKAAVCEATVSAGHVLSGHCGGGRWSGPVGVGVHGKVGRLLCGVLARQQGLTAVTLGQ